MPWACQDWANTKAAYRFFANRRVDEATILGGISRPLGHEWNQYEVLVQSWCCTTRQSSLILKRDTGVDISRSTMDGWVMRVGELLMPLVSRMKNDLLAGHYI